MSKTQFELEKQVQEILKWTPQQIARSSQTQLVAALKTPLAKTAEKEVIVNLDCFGSASKVLTSSQSVKMNFNNSVNNKMDCNQLMQSLQNLKIKHSAKTEFKNSKLTQLEPNDIYILDKAIQKDLDDITKLNKQISQLLSDLNILIADKRDLLTILEPDDISISQIKLRIEQLSSQIDLLKKGC